jgi:thiol-disulfide isomerase/thioredoxin
MSSDYSVTGTLCRLNCSVKPESIPHFRTGLNRRADRTAISVYIPRLTDITQFSQFTRLPLLPFLEPSMPGIAGLILLPYALLSADPTTYQMALREAETKNRPLVVLVGADWCPGCRTMKQSVLPALVRRGAMRDVSFVAVDADAAPRTARQLMRGNSIPQLIAFSRTAEGKWQREQITGATSEASVESLIARALTPSANFPRRNSPTNSAEEPVPRNSKASGKITHE